MSTPGMSLSGKVRPQSMTTMSSPAASASSYAFVKAYGFT